MTLSDPKFLIEQQILSSTEILIESCSGLTKDQRNIVEGIYRDLFPLIEAALTADQIKQIFGQVERASIEAGGSRTALGKSVDVVKKANEIINKAGRWLQDTKPVKAFDQKFIDLTNKIKANHPDSKIIKGMSALGDFAKNNPGKTAVVIGILTAMAALGGGPVAGAIAGQVLRGTTELLKGEKLSTAIGKGAKSAALGALAGMTFNFLSDAAADLIANAKESAIGDQWNALDNAVREDALKGVRGEYGSFVDALDGAQHVKLDGNINGFVYDYDVILTADNYEKFKQLESNLQGLDTFSDKWVTETAKLHDFMMSMQSSPDQAYLRAASDAVKELDNLRADYSSIEKSGIFAKIDDLDAFKAAAAEYNPKLGAVVQAASQEATALANKAQRVKGKAKEGVYVQERPLSEGQVYMLFNNLETLEEANFIKRGAEWLGKQATEKNTASKLSKKWKAAGAPTDSEELKNFLINQGIAADVIDQIYAGMNLPSAATAAPDAKTLYSKAKKDLSGLNNKEKQRLIAYLQKTLGNL